MNLSIIIIAKNAQDQIKEAIESVTFADEIIVIDSGSTDKTVAVAKKLGATVYNFASNDFSQMRTFGLSKASSAWIYYLDTDERVTPELASNISKACLLYSQNVKNQVGKDNQFTVFKVKRKNFYLGNNEWPQIEKLERLFRKDALTGWYGELHESPSYAGEAGELEGFWLHYTHRDIGSMLDKTIRWSEIEAKLRLKTGHPQMSWWRFFRVMITCFFDYYVLQGGWKVGTVGLIESIYQSFSIFITYARLWELQQKEKK